MAAHLNLKLRAAALQQPISRRYLIMNPPSSVKEKTDLDTAKAF